MMIKPTPAQARALRILKDDGHMIAYMRGNRYFHCSVFNSGTRETRVSGPTVGALIQNEWIAPEKTGWGSEYVITPSGIEVVQSLREEDFIHPPTKKSEWTAGEITGMLRERYLLPEWIFFSELRAGSGYLGNAEQRIDAWAMHCWPSKKFIKFSFEIKVYRGDFLREIKDPTKRAFAEMVCNEFYFVTPEQLVKPKEIPDGCGLIWAYKDGRLITRKKAEFRQANNPSWQFVASLGRRLNLLEEKQTEAIL